MPNFTEKEIRKAFIRLIRNKPYKRITMKAVADECGINRNTVYYHYPTLPDLVEDIARRMVNKYTSCIQDADSLKDIQQKIIADLYAEKKAVLNIFKSANRDLFELYCWRLSEYAIGIYMDAVFKDHIISDMDKDIISSIGVNGFFGAFMKWLMNDMKEIDQDRLKRRMELTKGLSAEVIRRAEQ